MIGANLAEVLLLLGLTAWSGPTDLVEQLGSPVYRERESAETALASLGRNALPSLKQAKKSKDPEIQIRASALISRIESALLLQATMVPLDFQDTPIERVLQSINDRTGIAIGLDPEDFLEVRGRRLTLKSSAPIPFWKAMDAICEAGRLHVIPGAQDPLGQRESIALLHDRLQTEPSLVSDFGPFRIYLNPAQVQNELSLSQARTQPFNGRQRLMIVSGDLRPESPTSGRHLSVQLLVAAEPSLTISQNGMAKITAAIDDKGQSLLPSVTGSTFQHLAGYNGLAPSPHVRVRLDLSRPNDAGVKIRLLRGTIPITVASRKADPLEIRLAGSENQTFQSAEATVSIIAQRPRALGRPGTIDLAITQTGQSPQPLKIGEGEPLGYRPDTPQHQIEILDANGKSLAWFPSATFYNGEQTRLSLTIVGKGEPATPSTIRYHSMIRASADVPFEFRNLPLP